MHWAIWDAMFKAQNAFEGVISNFPGRLISILLRRIVFPIGRPYVVPADRLGAQVANLLIEPSATRDRLTAGMYVPRDENDAVGVIELALEATAAAEAIEMRMRAASKSGLIGGRGAELAKRALEAGVISTEDLAVLSRRDALRDKTIRVDDFPQDLCIHGRAEDRPGLRAVA